MGKKVLYRMIVGLGIDLVEIERIRKNYLRYGLRFVKKFLTDNEIDQMPMQPVAFLAGRFAAKEACVKALGTGFSSGISALQIEVCSSSQGSPSLRLTGKARSRADGLDVATAALSITHERSMACAIVILEKI